MKKSLALLTLLTGSLLLSGCKEELTGHIKVDEAFRMVDEKKKSYQITQSDQVTLKLKKKREIQFIYKIDGKERVFPIKTNFNVKDIQNGDKIFIPSSVSGQPFDISGDYRNEQTISERYRDRETCSYTTYHTECRDVYVPGACRTITECNPVTNKCKTRRECDPGRYHRECRQVGTTHYGYRDIEYYYVNKHMSLDLDLFDIAGNLAKVYADGSESNKHYSYTGQCYR